jgi:cytosine permease
MADQDHVIDAPAEDYTHSAVPLRERRDPFTMGLLWVTMVTGFPSVIAGYQWYGAGLGFPQVMLLSLISCALMLCYSLPACYLGARSGLTYALLSRKVFGRWGSRLVSLNLCWIAMCWYGLTAVFLAVGLKGVYEFPIPTPALSVGLAVAMAFNNFFGFSGIANFARYAAGPILIIWVLTTFFNAAAVCPSSVWTEPSRMNYMYGLAMVSSFTMGYAAWGNEADYWRFAKPKVGQILIPLAVALLIGQILFPLTGWMLGRMSGGREIEAAMESFAFGGIPIVIATVLTVCYFAVNDSCMYGAINALQNVTPLSRRKGAALLTVIGSISAAFLAGVSHNFEKVASISCIVLPCATVVILAETFRTRSAREIMRVPTFAELPAVRWKAVIALAIGCAVGIGTNSIHIGIPALQAWIATLVGYLLMTGKQYTVQPSEYTGEADDKPSRDGDPTHVGVYGAIAQRCGDGEG